MNEPWRQLRVGDRILIVRLPTAWEKPGIVVWQETRRVYKRLIARRRSARIYEIDEYGLPWIHCRFRRKDGTWEHHFLAVDDDSWVRVKCRV